MSKKSARGGAGAKDGNDRSIQVFLRARPLTGREIEDNDTCDNMKYDPNDPTRVTIQRPGHEPKGYYFNRVFGPKSTQQEVYEHFASQAVDSALDGFHGVMFVYGQTGSGKTFTISGPEADQLTPETYGVLQRSLRTMWDRMEADDKHEYECAVSYIQLYNELLSDLLEENDAESAVKLVGVPDRRSDLQIVSEKSGRAVGRPVDSYDDCIGKFNEGKTRIVMAETKMNKRSSRSHTVYTLYVKKRPRSADGGGRALEGRLILCDLAGSERVSKTEATGARLDEATSINGGLLVLGKVVAALTEGKAQHIPFRESKLTRLLQYSLSGWGKTSLVVNVSPSDYNTDETVAAVGFGQRATQISQNAQKHQVLDYKMLYLELQSQLDAQRDQAVSEAIAEERRHNSERVASLEERIEMLQAENQILGTNNQELQKENDALRSATDTASVPRTASQVAMGTSPGKPASFGASPTPQQQASSADIPLSPTKASLMGYSLTEVLTKLRSMVEARDKQLATESQRATDAVQAQMATENRLFGVARKYESYRMITRERITEYCNQINDLEKELACLKGTTYLNAAHNGQDDEKEAAKKADAASVSNRQPQKVVATSGGGGAAAPGVSAEEQQKLHEQLEQMQESLRELHKERSMMLVYQGLAKQAIRMLVWDLRRATGGGK